MCQSVTCSGRRVLLVLGTCTHSSAKAYRLFDQDQVSKLFLTDPQGPNSGDLLPFESVAHCLSYKRSAEKQSELISMAPVSEPGLSEKLWLYMHVLVNSCSIEIAEDRTSFQFGCTLRFLSDSRVHSATVYSSLLSTPNIFRRPTQVSRNGPSTISNPSLRVSCLLDESVLADTSLPCVSRFWNFLKYITIFNCSSIRLAFSCSD